MMDIVWEVSKFRIHGHFELYRYEEIDPFLGQYQFKYNDQIGNKTSQFGFQRAI